MKLEAAYRLQADDLNAITYEQYAKVIASLDTSRVEAFDFKIPSMLKVLKGDLGTLVESLKGVGVGIGEIIAAFQEKSVFKLLKGVGFSLKAILKGIKAAMGLPTNLFVAALQDLAATFKDTRYLRSLKPAERIAALEAVIKRNPVLSKLTGFAIAGLLLLMVFKASNTGHIERDLDVIESIIDALRGNYDLVDFFASAEGVNALATLVFGAMTGGSVVDYGLGALQQVASFIGDNAGSLLLCLFYTGAKKLRKRFGKPPAVLTSRRTQDWLSKLPHEDKHKYLSKYPGSKFKDKTKILHPTEIDAFKAFSKTIVASKEFKYAMVNRPLSIGTCPKGFSSVDPRPEKTNVHYEMARHGIITYPHALTDQETKAFELAPIVDPSDAELMGKYADAVIEAFGEYAKRYVAKYSGDRLENEVWDKLKSNCKGYMPSLDVKALTNLVVQKISKS